MIKWEWLYPGFAERTFYSAWSEQMAKDIDKEMLGYPETLMGYPVIYVDNLPGIKAESIILGDFTEYGNAEIFRQTFYTLFLEELAKWEAEIYHEKMYGTGTGEPIGIISQEDVKMLLTKRAKELMEEEQLAFVYTYEQMIESMVMTMQERGEGRDEETPIHFRRSPEANLEMVRSKCMRIESMLASLDPNDPEINILRKLRNESLDVANYALFTATNMELLISEKLLEDMNSISQEERDQLLNGTWSKENLTPDGIVEPEPIKGISCTDWIEFRDNKVFCTFTHSVCPREEAWGDNQFCVKAETYCNKSWLPKETGK